MKSFLPVAALAAVLCGQAGMAQAMGLTAAVGQTDDSTMTYRLGVQFDFERSWWETRVGRLTGYWDAGYTYWEGDETASNHSVSLSPVFVYEFAGERVRPFVELGIGIAAFSSTELEKSDLGSAFQFEDRLGAGLRFAGGHQVGVRAIHYSNAGLKKPNDGAESFSVYYQLPL